MLAPADAARMHVRQTDSPTAAAPSSPDGRRCRFSRRDWTGDCLITIFGGAVILAGVVLPWANDDTGHHVNLSLTRPDAIKSALGTDWGIAVLGLGLGVLVLGVLMLALGPRRLAVPSGTAITLAGIAVVVVAFRAAAAMAGLYKPGLGIYIDVLAAIVLVPTGFAAAVVGYLLAAEAKKVTP